MVAGKPVDLFNFGQMRRDFTYVDDVVEAVVRLVPCVPAADPAFDPREPDPATSSAPWRIYNIGNSDPVDLEVLLAAIEGALGRKAERNALPMQPGDVRATAAATDLLWRTIGWKPSTPIDEGVRRFVAWYREWVGP
jgi:UDP-glucuronate 4-epimerase